MGFEGGTTLPDVPVSKSKRSRYTPPPPKKAPASPLWVPVSLCVLMLTGLVVVLATMVILGLPVRWVLGPVTWPWKMLRRRRAVRPVP